MDINVRDLPANATLHPRLVDVDASMRQSTTSSTIARHQQDRTKTGRIPHTGCSHRTWQVTYGIIDAQSSSHRTARRTDIHIDFTLSALRCQKQQLRHYQAGHSFLNRTIDHNDTFTY